MGAPLATSADTGRLSIVYVSIVKMDILLYMVYCN